MIRTCLFLFAALALLAGGEALTAGALPVLR
jgi:hypothetical protein